MEKTPGKIQRSLNSSTDSNGTPNRQPTGISDNYFTHLDINSDSSSDSENTIQINTPKIITFFPQTSSNTMVENNSSPEVAPWIRIKNELLQCMQDLDINLTTYVKLMSSDLSKKFNDLVESNQFLEASFKEAKLEATEAKKQVESLNPRVQQQEHQLKNCENKIASFEAYSKYYNLKFLNIKESPNENFDILLEKMHHIFYLMEIDSTKFYLDTIHRLPSNNRGPRPLIVNFISKLDRDLVWHNKSKLGNTRCPVLIREHFDENTECNIKRLPPNRRAAIDMGKKVLLGADKLYINSTLYTVNNLKDLPPELSPDNLSNKTINNHTCYTASPFSNYFPSSFKVDGINYSHGEMYIQATKAGR